jgi:UDP-2,3-diacylglucosamine pyrophosphatase LpxH
MHRNEVKTGKRQIDITVISDVHLGTYGCHARELVSYLKSIQPRRIILNGDIVDVWQFSKRYWPKSHMQVVKQLLEFVAQGVQVDYITGNHDEMMRKFVGFELGSFRISNKLLLEIDNKKMWFFHGDVFDITMQHSRWLAKLGAIGYDALILLNRFVNWVLEKMGRERYSLSKNVKNSVKSAVKFISDFEQTSADIAIENGYDVVCCGHIHQPVMRDISTLQGSTTYINSGDWVENLTALEYHNGTWKIYEYAQDVIARQHRLDVVETVSMSSRELFHELLKEFGEFRRTGVRKTGGLSKAS